jgi:hypothetical protein
VFAGVDVALNVKEPLMPARVGQTPTRDFRIIHRTGVLFFLVLESFVRDLNARPNGRVAGRQSQHALRVGKMANEGAGALARMNEAMG